MRLALALRPECHIVFATQHSIKNIRCALQYIRIFISSAVCWQYNVCDATCTTVYWFVYVTVWRMHFVLFIYIHTDWVAIANRVPYSICYWLLLHPGEYRRSPQRGCTTLNMVRVTSRHTRLSIYLYIQHHNIQLHFEQIERYERVMIRPAWEITAKAVSFNAHNCQYIRVFCV